MFPQANGLCYHHYVNIMLIPALLDIPHSPPATPAVSRFSRFRIDAETLLSAVRWLANQ